jgi:hypothetical protein
MKRHRIVVPVVIAALGMLLLIDGLSLPPSSAHYSPLATPTPLAQSEGEAFPPVFFSPLALPGLFTEPLTVTGYLPVVLYRHPLPLTYGPKGLAGLDVFGLNSDHDVYYNWDIGPLALDPRRARMVWCVSDYHLYGYEYTWLSGTQTVTARGLNWQHAITMAATWDAAHVSGRVWLVLNEPDNGWGTPGAEPDDTGQCGVYPIHGHPDDRANLRQTPTISVSARWTADQYSLVYDWIKAHDPSARVFVGGLLALNTAETRDWWTEFVDQLADNGAKYKIEGVHIHSYPGWSTYWNSQCRKYSGWCLPRLATVLNDWYDNYHDDPDFGLGDREIWITEIGSAPWCHEGRWSGQEWSTSVFNSVRDNFMQPMTWWFTADSRWPYDPGTPVNPGYDAMLWFVPWTEYNNAPDIWWCTFLQNENQGTPYRTPLGTYWQNTSFQP